MKQLYNLFLAIFLFFIFIVPNLKAQEVTPEDLKEQQKLDLMSNQKVGFLENKGQIRQTDGNSVEALLYTVNINGISIYLKENGISYVLKREVDDIEESGAVVESDTPHNSRKLNTHPAYEAYRFDLEFIGSNKNLDISANGQLPGVHNFFRDKDSKQLGIRKFRTVYYANLYDGIDVKFYISDNQFKYDFIIHPGANPEDIKLQYLGPEKLYLENGDLVIFTPFGSLNESIPVSYEIESDVKTEIKCEYILSKNIISFKLAQYNISNTIIIDPTLKWSTYLGGSNQERVGVNYNQPSQAYYHQGGLPAPLYFSGGGITYDHNDDIIITGSTMSNDFPSTIGNWYYNQWEVFTSKFDGESHSLLWSCYHGHYQNEFATGIDVDNANNIYVVGSTNSELFHTYQNAAQQSCASCFSGQYDAFILKFNPDGTEARATFWGGSDNEFAHGITVCNYNRIAIIGETFSSDFPTTLNAQQPYCASCSTGESDVFVTIFTTDLTSELLSTFWGGESTEYGFDIDAAVLDGTEYLLMTGATNSSDFPVNNQFQQFNQGLSTTNYDGFVTILEPNSAVPFVSTYYGGADDEYALGICYGTGLEFGVTGFTLSDVTNDQFPQIIQPNSQADLDNIPGGNDAGDAFFAVYKMAAVNPSLGSSNYLGGSIFEFGRDVDFNPMNGCYYITGYTNSPDFPIRHFFRDELNRGQQNTYYDVFVAKYHGFGILRWATYYGSDMDDWGNGVACSKNSVDVTIFGETTEPMTKDIQLLGTPYQGAYNGGSSDVFLASFNEDPMLPTYHGGNFDDIAEDLVTDEDDFIYVTGVTFSNDFPTTVGIIDETYNGNGDIFVSKFTDMGLLVYSTYYGGSNYDHAKAIAIEPVSINSDIYISGRTLSGNLAATDPSCPLCTSYQSNMTYTEDAFLMRISNDGTVIKWFTYFGGYTQPGYNECAEGVTVSRNGAVYITGRVGSDISMQADNSVSPPVPPYQSKYMGPGTGGGNDGFIAKFDIYGNLIWSTYWGGYYEESGLDISIIDTHYPELVALCGWTNSYGWFPTSPNAFKTEFQEACYPLPDAFYSVVDAHGNMVYSTLFGGLYSDTATCIHSTNNSQQYFNVYVGGHTESFQNEVWKFNGYNVEGTFPIITQYGTPYQATHANNNGSTRNLDGFVLTFSEFSLWAPEWSTYIGAGATTSDPNSIQGRDMVYDIFGKGDNIYIAGATTSMDLFNGKTANRSAHSSYPFEPENYDAFILSLDNVLNEQAFIEGAYYGEGEDDWATGVSRYLVDYTVFCGGTESSDLYPNDKIHELSEQRQHVGGRDAFVAITKASNSPKYYLPTYIGGNNDDGIRDMVVCSDGSIVVAGYTSSPDFPATIGDSYNSVLFRDIFVAKFYPSGEFKWATCYGGDYNEIAYGIAENPIDQKLYVTGSVCSNDLNIGFPNKASLPTDMDAFLMQMDQSGNMVDWFRYYGMDDVNNFYNDISYTIDIGNNLVYIGGVTAGSRILNGNFQNNCAGYYDGFVSAFSLNGSLLWESYLGGSANDQVYDLVYNETLASVAVVGYTWSDDFPVSQNAYQGNYAGNCDGFLSVFSYTGNMMDNSFFGGSELDQFHGLDESGGSLIVAGCTSSPGLATTGVIGQTMGSNHDGILVRYNTFDYNPQWISYIGGDDGDECVDVKILEDKFYVLGFTASSNDIATSGAFDETLNGVMLNFMIMEIAPDCQTLNWGTYLANNVVTENVFHSPLALNLSNNWPIIAGTVVYDAINIPTAPNAFQNTATSSAGYIARISPDGTYLAKTIGGKEIDEEEIDKEEIIVDENIKVYVYPNPTENYVVVESDKLSDYIVTVCNLDGRFLLNSEKTAGNYNKLEFDLTEFPVGSYYITIDTGNGSISKLIIKR